MRALLFSDFFINAVQAQRDYYRREHEAADNAQAYYSNRGAADCCDYFADFCTYLLSLGVAGREALAARLLDEVVVRIELEKARYWSTDSPSVYVDAAGWGIALRWLNTMLISYSVSPLLR